MVLKKKRCLCSRFVLFDASPTVGVAGVEFVHDGFVSVFEVDAQGVGHAGDDEHHVGEFEGDGAFGLVFFLGFFAVCMVDFPRQFAELFGEAGDEAERLEVAFFELGDVVVDLLLHLFEGEGGGLVGSVVGHGWVVPPFVVGNVSFIIPFLSRRGKKALYIMIEGSKTRIL